MARKFSNKKRPGEAFASPGLFSRIPRALPSGCLLARGILEELWEVCRRMHQIYGPGAGNIRYQAQGMNVVQQNVDQCALRAFQTASPRFMDMFGRQKNTGRTRMESAGGGPNFALRLKLFPIRSPVKGTGKKRWPDYPAGVCPGAVCVKKWLPGSRRSPRSPRASRAGPCPCECGFCQSSHQRGCPSPRRRAWTRR